MIKTSLHELSHTFGIDHCVEFHCIMNSLYIKQSYKNPIYFCPICLCKLYIGLNLDLEKRYKDLYLFYTNNGTAKNTPRNTSKNNIAVFLFLSNQSNEDYLAGNPIQRCIILQNFHNKSEYTFQNLIEYIAKSHLHID